MRKVSDKSCKENQSTFYVPQRFSWKSSRLWVMWKYIEQPDRPQVTIRRMHFACWITKAKDTCWEYIIIIAFPVQQCLSERALVLHLQVHCTSC
jgi:hypothetical protein